jgi:hypothetical protein
MFKFENGRLSCEIHDSREVPREIAQTIALINIADYFEDLRDSLFRIEDILNMFPDNVINELKKVNAVNAA